MAKERPFRARFYGTGCIARWAHTGKACGPAPAPRYTLCGIGALGPAIDDGQDGGLRRMLATTMAHRGSEQAFQHPPVQWTAGVTWQCAACLLDEVWLSTH